MYSASSRVLGGEEEEEEEFTQFETKSYCPTERAAVAQRQHRPLPPFGPPPLDSRLLHDSICQLPDGFVRVLIFVCHVYHC